MPAELELRVAQAYQRATSVLLARRNGCGFWEGRLSSSALSTATAIVALEMVRRQESARSPDDPPFERLISRGLAWIAERQNADGGWGDTVKSLSNISTTMLCRAAFVAAGAAEAYRPVLDVAAGYIERSGGISALRARYGKDKTFSIPILTHCALAGVVEWQEVAPLPFELACLPARFYKWLRLPVVSYALPALIAIGQVRHHFAKPRNPVVRFLRDRSITRSLAVLERIQPASGGFLEATPLTSFVTMSLAGMGLANHPVARRGVEFLVGSAREDGSWPIDTNLATWVTTLSVSALGDDLPAEAALPLRDWLLSQQYREVHPYTNADPGGWAWTDLPGGVPDADDTPGAMLALVGLSALQSPTLPPGEESDQGRQGDKETRRQGEDAAAKPPGARSPCLPLSLSPCLPHTREERDASDVAFDAITRGVAWLLDLQNRDGGWPTFCRGWGALPFDRSAPDLTAHALRALGRWMTWGLQIMLETGDPPGADGSRKLAGRAKRAIVRGFAYLERTQRADGSWLPLWFGNQHAPGEENPTYGTARVLAAFRDFDRRDSPACGRGLEWLRSCQNADGSWGGAAGVRSSTEETALALEVLISLENEKAVLSDTSRRGLVWLLDQVERGNWVEPSPIGFYFAKLWYFEDLYPLIFTVAALRRAVEKL